MVSVGGHHASKPCLGSDLLFWNCLWKHTTPEEMLSFFFQSPQMGPYHAISLQHSKHKSLKNCHKVFFYYGKLTAIFLVKSHLHNGPFNFPEIFLSNRKSDFCALCNSIIRKSKQNFCITTSGSVLEAAKLRSNPNLRWWKVPWGATCEPSCKAKWWTKDQGQPWLRKVKKFCHRSNLLRAELTMSWRFQLKAMLAP